MALSPLYSPSFTQPFVLAPRWTTATFSYPPQTSIPTFTSTSSSSSLPTPVAQTSSSSVFISLPTPSPTSTTSPSTSSEQSGKSLLVCSGIREDSEIAGLGEWFFFSTSFCCRSWLGQVSGFLSMRRASSPVRWFVIYADIPRLCAVIAVVAALLPRADIDGKHTSPGQIISWHWVFRNLLDPNSRQFGSPCLVHRSSIHTQSFVVHCNSHILSAHSPPYFGLYCLDSQSITGAEGSLDIYAMFGSWEYFNPGTDDLYLVSCTYLWKSARV